MVLQFMKIDLEIIRIALPAIPPGSLRRMILMQKFEKEKLSIIITCLHNDLEKIKSCWSLSSDAELLEDVLKPLQYFFVDIQQLPAHNVKSILNKYVRIFRLVIINRLDSLLPDTRIQFNKFIKEVDSLIGQVPRLNSDIPLPDRLFLPEKFDKTSRKWSKMPYENPGRSSSTEPIDFFKRGDKGLPQIASVRNHLIAFDYNPRHVGEALSYADAAFYRHGDLHADHLQSAESLIERQKEMILAMNVDPLFAEEVFPIGSQSSYFIRNSLGKISGSKYFFMVYHNCVDNLWLISAAENSGSGKGGQDAIQWLEKHDRFGRGFFESLSGKIDKTKILYMADGKILAAKAKEWFKLQYKDEIFLDSAIKVGIIRPMKHRASLLVGMPSGHEKKKASVALMATLVVSQEVVAVPEKKKGKKHSRKDSGSETVDSSDAEVGEKNVERMRPYVPIDTLMGVVDSVVDDFTRRRQKVPRI